MLTGVPGQITPLQNSPRQYRPHIPYQNGIVKTNNNSNDNNNYYY
jgi:hypothetical protein